MQRGQSLKVAAKVERLMHPSVAVRTMARRLVPAVYGVARNGVRTNLASETTVPCTVGDDAFVLSQSPAQSHQFIGVADGVGGWHAEGLDPSLFAKALLRKCAKLFMSGRVQHPKEILKWAYEEVLWVEAKTYGSCTVSLLSLDGNESIVHSANLGDSGFLVARKGQLVAKSQPEVHYFNCPFQLSNHPPWHMHHISLISDHPSSALQTSVQVREGDMVLLSSDGLFNNVYEDEILKVLKDVQATDKEDIQKACSELAERAYVYSHDTNYLSPFAREGCEALSWRFYGGKPDDITVILAGVANAEES